MQLGTVLKLTPSTITITRQDLERKVNDTVRYALACEHRKQVIRKDDITRKGTHPFFLKTHGCSVCILTSSIVSQSLQIARVRFLSSLKGHRQS